jgi:hypothetical protein
MTNKQIKKNKMKRSELKNVIREVIKEETSKSKRTLKEASKYTIDDFSIGTIITFKNKEEFIVVKKGKIVSSGNFYKSNEVLIKPYNKLAKDRNISLATPMSIEQLNQEQIKISK